MKFNLVAGTRRLHANTCRASGSQAILFELLLRRRVDVTWPTTANVPLAA